MIHRRVAVIGAGFAGVRVAYVLAREGVDVTVLEARDRVGGRVWSQFPFASQTRVERGAEYVLPGNVTVERVAAELGLGLVPTGMSYGVREPRGGAPTSEDAIRAAALHVVGLIGADPDLAGGISAAELLERAVVSGADPAAVEAVRSRAEATNGVRLDLLPAGSLADLDEGTRDIESRRVAGGNQQIALRMAQTLGGSVWFGHAVERVDRSDGRVTVRGQAAGFGGFELVVDACVVAVPMLHARELLAGLEGAGPAVAVLDRLGQGHAAKLHVPLLVESGAPTEPGAVLDVPGRWWSWTATDGGASVAPVVSCFAGSAQGLAALRVDSGPARWTARLAELRPELALDAEQALLSTWHDDPWALGAYSYPIAGAWPGGEPVELERHQRLVGAVVLAGEWTAGEWSGLMEGALRTGERAAADVLDLLSGQTQPGL